MRQNYVPGFVYARAVLSLFVVLWHAHAIPRPTSGGVTLNNVLNYQLLLIAVPGFVLISCYLFVLHGGGMERLKAASGRMAALLIFWTAVFYVGTSGWSGLVDFAKLFLDNPLKAFIGAAGTVYYFFASLLCALAATELCRRGSSITNLVVLAISSALLVGMPLLKQISPFLSTHWNPLNFLPYAPAAVLIVRHQERVSALMVAGACVIISAVLATMEWTLLPISTTDWVPPYTRISLVPTAIAIVFGCLSVSRSPGRVAQYMADRSLALYCLHPLVLTALGAALGEGWPLAGLAIAISYLVAACILPRILMPALYR
ncbi:acyltransferase family protein [Achromobacter mucicolens]|uniref:acyltransferase family protein n=1 Tax=Achromobacter mucicolens TaxID=1389922 RepID=UPI00289B0759|nr:acyltransferase family protein [Achromobacter mucicolens]